MKKVFKNIHKDSYDSESESGKDVDDSSDSDSSNSSHIMVPKKQPKKPDSSSYCSEENDNAGPAIKDH